ncbi:MAG: ETC complex I subunit [Alphaproteobacteria bacterium]|nr:ETC complex I subunit [Alphaproteobacteria bacterium]
MTVRIYRPAKTAMQSGRGLTQEWLLEFEPGARRPEPLMGWTASDDTLAQVRLRFETKDEAIAYARKHGLQFVLEEPQERRIKPKAYADNFRFGRLRPWTH